MDSLKGCYVRDSLPFLVNIKLVYMIEVNLTAQKRVLRREESAMQAAVPFSTLLDIIPSLAHVIVTGSVGLDL